MVHPWRLLALDGFLEALEDMAGDSVKAHVDRWYTKVTWVVDTIAPKCTLCFRVQVSPQFMVELQAMKFARRQLESRWKKDQLDHKLIAVKSLTRRYANTIKLVKEAYNIKLICEALNQQKELFWEVHGLTTPSQLWPCPSFSLVINLQPF